MNNQKLLKTLKSIIDVLSLNKKITFDKYDLFNISETKIDTPIGDPLTFFKQKSKSEDKIIDLDLLKQLVNHINNNDLIVRLNHIGFGYIVDSKQDEKQRLIKLVQKTTSHLYEEESNDFGLWLFMGDTKKWQNPLVEFVTVNKNQENYDEFLPHIQIDVDTKLDAVEIENLINKCFGGEIKPYRIAVINGITYIVRLKLGILERINIFLDLATNSRDVKFHRENFLKKIS